MEKRVLLAVLLSFLVLYGYQALFVPPEPAQPGAKPTPASEPAQPAAGHEAPQVQPVEAAPVLSDSAERDVTFENDSVSAVFTTRGGALKSWRLKKYLDATHQPLELVPNPVPPGTPRQFTLSAQEPVGATLSQALYKPSATQVQVTTAPATLTFEYQDASGLSARKEFTFTPDAPYVITLSATVTQGGREIVPTVHGGPGIGSGIVVSSMGMYSPPPQPIFSRDGKESRIPTSDIPKHAAMDGAFGFVGVDDHYFLSAAVPGGQPLHVEYRPLDVPVPATQTVAHFVEWSVRYPTAPRNARFFFGPKDLDVLRAVDIDLTRSIHWGYFGWLAVPLLQALKWINGYVGNYGWSIVLLTVIINLAMFPLRHKSVVSMRRMQEIQPEVKAIQDRYAKLKMTDPARQKMNTEMMSLYRERGVNPASGCVPMLLTMPVLLAFYSMLSVAIEIRGAPFIGWIRDLSVYDPLFITPVLMGLTQLVQTRMTPSTADPMQQKMMLFMPLIFMTMFIWAPSGLVLYWTVSNLWAIGQQTLTNRIIGPPALRGARPAADRKVKNVGGGKTDQASGKADQAAKERK